MKMESGFLDLSPRHWEMSVWFCGDMLAYAFSVNGLDWKCRSLSDKKDRATLYGKGNAEVWLKERIKL